MPYIGIADPFHKLSDSQREEVVAYVTRLWPLIGSRFVDWASSCLGRDVTLQQIADPIVFANTLLELDEFPVDLEPLMPLFWRHHPTRYVGEEMFLAKIEFTQFLWILKQSSMFTIGEVDFRPAHFNAGELECGFVIHGAPVYPDFPGRTYNFRRIIPWRETFRSVAFYSLPVGVKPWFDSGEFDPFAGPVFDLSVVRCGRGEFQIYFAIAENYDDGVERQEEAKRLLLALLPSFPGVVSVVEEDREIVAVEAKGWRSPVKQLRAFLESSGAPLSTLLVDPDVESI
jgi:hypothetical protein